MPGIPIQVINRGCALRRRAGDKAKQECISAGDWLHSWNRTEPKM